MQLFMKTSVVSVINLEKKHVLGTASTAGSLCFFELGTLGRPGPRPRGERSQSTIIRFDQN